MIVEKSFFDGCVELRYEPPKITVIPLSIEEQLLSCSSCSPTGPDGCPANWGKPPS